MPSLLCFVAHPDDETVFIGGALALLAEKGVAARIVSLTRGEGGEVGEPPLCSQDALGSVREQEMECAVRQLGVVHLAFLGYVDPRVGPDDTLFVPDVNLDQLISQLIEHICLWRPDVVLTHGSNGEYGHPAHQLMHSAVCCAVRELEPAAPLFYSFGAAYPDHPYPRLSNPDNPADLIVDVSSVMDKKEAAALCHATQVPLFVRRRSRLAGRQLSVREVLLSQEALHLWPAADGVPPDLLKSWLRPWLLLASAS